MEKKMNFNEKLNDYITELDCTAKELSAVCGLSPATISRYRSGERMPEIDSDAFTQLCEGIASLLREKNGDAALSKSEIERGFFTCSDIISTSKENLRQKLNILISVMNINISKLCQSTNYEASALFRIRNGSRKPSDPIKFTSDIAGFVVRETKSPAERKLLSELIGCTFDETNDSAVLFDRLRDWLIAGQKHPKYEISEFLVKLNDFDLNEYIRVIHFDELKVPTVPFQLPTSKTYFGLQEMMTAELDFLKTTVLSKSLEPVIMYSDMPMDKMAKDADFPKKWMFGMAMMLKKKLHLNMIHSIDRPFEEMMLGLESFIPMYMTGQISPYYLDGAQNDVFLHFLKVSGTAAISGEAISGHHEDGKYYLTKNKDEVAYYKKRARELLAHANPLMEIYTSPDEAELHTFLLSDSQTDGKRRSILSAPPLYVFDREKLELFLSGKALSEEEKKKILDQADTQRQIIEKILENNIVEDEIPILSKEEFEKHPLVVSLSSYFMEKDIFYTFEEYSQHIRIAEEFEKQHPNYCLKKTSAFTFRNLRIDIHEGKWVMVSKSKSPAIVFLIRHPRICQAIELFVPPVTEE